MRCCKQQDQHEYFGICKQPVLENDWYLKKMFQCTDVNKKFVGFFIYTKPDEFNSKLLIFKIIFDYNNTIPLLSPSLECKLFEIQGKTAKISFLYTIYKLFFSQFKFNKFIKSYTLENYYIFFFFKNIWCIVYIF